MSTKDVQNKIATESRKIKKDMIDSEIGIQ